MPGSISCGAVSRAFVGLGHCQTCLPPPAPLLSPSDRPGECVIWDSGSTPAALVPLSPTHPKRCRPFSSERPLPPALAGQIRERALPRRAHLPAGHDPAQRSGPRLSFPQAQAPGPAPKVYGAGSVPAPGAPSQRDPRSRPASERAGPAHGERGARTARSAAPLAGVTALRAVIGCGRRQAAEGPGAARPPLPLPAGG